MNISKIQKNTTVIVGLISGISLILGILFDYLFYSKLPGVNFLIFIILIISGLFVISYVLKKQIDKKVIWLLIPLLFFSTMIFIRTSSFLIFLNIVICLLLLLLIAKTLYGKKIEKFLIRDYIKAIFLPFRFISPLFQTLSKIFSSYKVSNNKKVLAQVLRGIVMAIPIILIFILLFSSADLIFQKYISDLITINIQAETVFRFTLILIVTLIFIGAYSYIFQESKEKTDSKLEEKKHLIGKVESSVVFSSINILFFLFILVQLTYLFGGESNISVQGFTYAEYARRGFFELISVAVFSLLLLLSFEKYVVRNGKMHTFGFKILSTLMIVQVIVIMVSAFTRLLLYERAYGFTTLRLYSHSFIIVLAIIFVLLIYKIYIDRRERAFALRVFVLIVLSLVGMNFLNPDLFIAKQNIERFNSTEKLDVYYLSNLSDDAIPEVVKLLDILDGDMKMSLGSELYWRTQRENESKDWQSFNISRMEAKKILESKEEELEKYKDSQ
ncbi:MAG: DUF4173 domain-containing protein [Candidatus Dojkabacteria bacterium]|jgi:hypothetical protein|nr:DUF4173 domain-containing protein [Candidatus Dojkabacteria bacterium]